jgi:hypothetical protein
VAPHRSVEGGLHDGRAGRVRTGKQGSAFGPGWHTSQPSACPLQLGLAMWRIAGLVLPLILAGCELEGAHGVAAPIAASVAKPYVLAGGVSRSGCDGDPSCSSDLDVVPPRQAAPPAPGPVEAGCDPTNPRCDVGRKCCDTNTGGFLPPMGAPVFACIAPTPQGTCPLGQ